MQPDTNSFSNEPHIPRTVKPRKANNTFPHFIVVTPQEFIWEGDGVLRERDDLAEYLEQYHEPAIIICGNPHLLLHELDDAYTHRKDWQFRVSPIVYTRMTLDGELEDQREVVVNFFGFKRPNHHVASRFFYPLSPEQFCNTRIRTLIPGDMPYWKRLLKWGLQVREFCEENALKISPTQGGLAAQLLRDPRFYPSPRRKVPRSTNERARKRLPGNYFELRAETHRIYGAALYIDQSSAHHYAASTVHLPHPDYLRAWGRFDENEDTPWALPGTEEYEQVCEQYGLLKVRAEIPEHLPKERYVPPHLWHGGDKDVFVYTNELAELIDLGMRIRWISAAWTSRERDTGIQKYAEWAMSEGNKKPETLGWKKPALLAAYGLLAARPKQLAFGWAQAENGTPERWVIGGQVRDLLVTRTKKKMQTPLANVIQRGMIEAETRRISLSLARDLENEGREVLSVYADAVIVRDNSYDDTPVLPLLPAPWRVKQRLKFIKFHDPQSFESDMIMRMPGRPGERLAISKKRKKQPTKIGVDI